MYIAAYRIFLDNKFFGVGPRQFRNECQYYPVSEYSCDSHPHNTYLELLSEAGMLAFLIVALTFIYVCYISIKHLIFKINKNKQGLFNDFEVCLFSAIIISLWPFSPSGSFFNNWMSIVYYLPVGIILWQIDQKKIDKINI
jgi:O-antigen ligase